MTYLDLFVNLKRRSAAELELAATSEFLTDAGKAACIAKALRFRREAANAIITVRLNELDISTEANNARCDIYNKRRVELAPGGLKAVAWFEPRYNCFSYWAKGLPFYWERLVTEYEKTRYYRNAKARIYGLDTVAEIFYTSEGQYKYMTDAINNPFADGIKPLFAHPAEFRAWHEEPGYEARVAAGECPSREDFERTAQGRPMYVQQSGRVLGKRSYLPGFHYTDPESVRRGYGINL